ncbi:hypothetical protein L5D95_10420 [Streptococcus pneumoniae]|nr:hypothetical protein HMPREF9281_02386 [Staphylococcus epidermidis BVS058A4]MDR6745634.1 low affinity Fe/Cu permease [Staphylococcus epidermidis]MDV8169474.1 hypothetical protein [Streptococcus pneumoniae]
MEKTKLRWLLNGIYFAFYFVLIVVVWITKIKIYDNTWSIVIFLGSIFIFRILIDYFAPKQRRSDNDGNN